MERGLEFPTLMMTGFTRGRPMTRIQPNRTNVPSLHHENHLAVQTSIKPIRLNIMKPIRLKHQNVHPTGPRCDESRETLPAAPPRGSYDGMIIPPVTAIIMVVTASWIITTIVTPPCDCNI